MISCWSDSLGRKVSETELGSPVDESVRCGNRCKKSPETFIRTIYLSARGGASSYPRTVHRLSPFDVVLAAFSTRCDCISENGNEEFASTR
eukprot:6173647-Pleurochrysis_carterae.AAC.2